MDDVWHIQKYICTNVNNKELTYVLVLYISQVKMVQSIRRKYYLYLKLDVIGASDMCQFK